MLCRVLILAAGLWLVCPTTAAGQIFRPQRFGGHSWIPYDPASMSFGLTPEQAAERVRAWMQNPTLQLQVVGVATDRTDDYLQLSPWPTWQWELKYLLEGSDGKHYFVRIHPWVSIEYYDMSADTPLVTYPRRYISDATRQAVAEAFIRARNPDLWGAEHRQDHFDRVTARYQGVIHPLRYTSCRVHRETGALIGCVMTDPGVPAIPLTPTVSALAAQAIAIPFLLQSHAYVAAAPSNADDRALCLFLHSDEMALVHRLAWSVPLTATRDNPPTQDGIWYEHDVYVDAHTGEPFRIDSYLGGKAPARNVRLRRRTGLAALLTMPLRMAVGDREVITAMPPLLIHGKPYLWAGWLRNSLVRGDGTAVTYSSGQLTLARHDTTRVVPIKPLGPGTKQADRAWNGGFIVGNRCYVPLKTVQGFSGLHVSYDARGRRVRLGPLEAVRR
jgi:hypothetical protein